MGSELPDLTRLESVPVRVWIELREQLRRAGFTEAYPSTVRQPAIGAHPESLQLPVVLWHLRRRRDVSAYAFRMFVLGDPVRTREAGEVLTPKLTKDLLDAGSHDETNQLLVADAQTSGGLVFGVDPGESAGVLATLTASGHIAAVIGQTAEGAGRFRLR